MAGGRFGWRMNLFEWVFRAVKLEPSVVIVCVWVCVCVCEEDDMNCVRVELDTGLCVFVLNLFGNGRFHLLFSANLPLPLALLQAYNI